MAEQKALTLKQAKHLLRTLSDSETFYVKDHKGKKLMTVTDLEGLVAALKLMPLSTFMRHNTAGDFHKWIRWIGYDLLADSFLAVKGNKDKAVKAVETGVNYLKSFIDQHIGSLEKILEQNKVITEDYELIGSDYGQLLTNLITHVPEKEKALYLEKINQEIVKGEDINTALRGCILEDIYRFFSPKGKKLSKASIGKDPVLVFASRLNPKRTSQLEEIEPSSRPKPLETIIRGLVKPIFSEDFKKRLDSLEYYYMAKSEHPFEFYELLFCLDILSSRAKNGTKKFIASKLDEFLQDDDEFELDALMLNACSCLVEEDKVYADIKKWIDTSAEDNSRYKAFTKELESKKEELKVSEEIIGLFNELQSKIKSGGIRYRSLKKKKFPESPKNIPECIFEFDEETSKISKLADDNLRLMGELKKKMAEKAKKIKGHYGSIINTTLTTKDYAKGGDFSEDDIKSLDELIQELDILKRFYSAARLGNTGKKLVRNIDKLKRSKTVFEKLLPVKESIEKTVTAIDLVEEEIMQVFRDKFNASEIKRLGEFKKTLNYLKGVHSEDNIRKEGISNLTCLTKSLKSYKTACTSLELVISRKIFGGLRVINSYFNDENFKKKTEKTGVLDDDLDKLADYLKSIQLIRTYYDEFSALDISRLQGIDIKASTLNADSKILGLESEVKNLQKLKRKSNEIKGDTLLLESHEVEIYIEGLEQFIDQGKKSESWIKSLDKEYIARIGAAKQALEKSSAKYDSYANEPYLSSVVKQHGENVSRLDKSTAKIIGFFSESLEDIINKELALTKTDINKDKKAREEREKRLNEIKPVYDIFTAVMGTEGVLDSRITDEENSIKELQKLKRKSNEIEKDIDLLESHDTEIYSEGLEQVILKRKNSETWVKELDEEDIARIASAKETLKSSRGKYDSYSSEPYLSSVVEQHKKTVSRLDKSTAKLTGVIQKSLENIANKELTLTNTDISKDKKTREQRLEELNAIKPVYDIFTAFMGTEGVLDIRIAAEIKSIDNLKQKEKIAKKITADKKNVAKSLNLLTTSPEKIAFGKSLTEKDKEKIQLIGDIREKIRGWSGKYKQHETEEYLGELIAGKPGFNADVDSLRSSIDLIVRGDLSILGMVLEKGVELTYSIDKDRKAFESFKSQQEVLEILYTEFGKIEEEVKQQLADVSGKIKNTKKTLEDLDVFESFKKEINGKTSSINAEILNIGRMFSEKPSLELAEKLGKIKEKIIAWKTKYEEHKENKYLAGTVEKYDGTGGRLESKLGEKLNKDFDFIADEFSGILSKREKIHKGKKGLKSLEDELEELKSLEDELEELSCLHHSYYGVAPAASKLNIDIKHDMEAETWEFIYLLRGGDDERPTISSDIYELKLRVDLKSKLQDDIKRFRKLKKESCLTKKGDIKTPVRLLFNLVLRNEQDKAAALFNQWNKAFAEEINAERYHEYDGDSYIGNLVKSYNSFLDYLSLADGVIDEIKTKIHQRVETLGVSRTDNLDKAMKNCKNLISAFEKYGFIYSHLKIQDETILKIMETKDKEFKKELDEFDGLCEIKEKLSKDKLSIFVSNILFKNTATGREVVNENMDEDVSDEYSYTTQGVIQTFGELFKDLDEKKNKYEEYSENKYLKNLVAEYNADVAKHESQIKQAVDLGIERLNLLQKEFNLPKTSDLDKDLMVFSKVLSNLNAIHPLYEEFIRIGEKRAKHGLKTTKKNISSLEKFIAELKRLKEIREQIRDDNTLLLNEYSNIDSISSLPDNHELTELTELHAMTKENRDKYEKNKYLENDLERYAGTYKKFINSFNTKITEIISVVDNSIKEEFVSGKYDLEKEEGYTSQKKEELEDLWESCAELSDVDFRFEERALLIAEKIEHINELSGKLKEHKETREHLKKDTKLLAEQQDYIKHVSHALGNTEDTDNVVKLAEVKDIVQEYKEKYGPNKYLEKELETYNAAFEDFEKTFNSKLEHFDIEFKKVIDADMVSGKYDLKLDMAHMAKLCVELNKIIPLCKTLSAVDSRFEKNAGDIDDKIASVKKVFEHLNSYSAKKEKINTAAEHMLERAGKFSRRALNEELDITFSSILGNPDYSLLEKELAIVPVLGKERRRARQYKINFSRHRRNKYLKHSFEEYYRNLSTLSDNIEGNVRSVISLFSLSISSDIERVNDLFLYGMNKKSIILLNDIADYCDIYAKFCDESVKNFKEEEILEFKGQINRLGLLIYEKKEFAITELDSKISKLKDIIWKDGESYTIPVLADYSHNIDDIKIHYALLGHTESDSTVAEIQDKIKYLTGIKKDIASLEKAIAHVSANYGEGWLKKSSEDLKFDFDSLERYSKCKDELIKKYHTSSEQDNALVRKNLELTKNIEELIFEKLRFAAKKSSAALEKVKREYSIMHPPDIEFDLKRIEFIESVASRIVGLYHNIVNKEFSNFPIEEWVDLANQGDSADLVMGDIKALKNKYSSIKKTKQDILKIECRISDYISQLPELLKEGEFGMRSVEQIKSMKSHVEKMYASVKEHLSSPYIDPLEIERTKHQFYSIISMESTSCKSKIKTNIYGTEENKRMREDASWINLPAKRRAAKNIDRLMQERYQLETRLQLLEKIDYKG